MKVVSVSRLCISGPVHSIMYSQREVERRERERREREQLAVAVVHYTRGLLRTRGLGAWLRFMEDRRRERERAAQFHTHWRSGNYHCVRMCSCLTVYVEEREVWFYSLP